MPYAVRLLMALVGGVIFYEVAIRYMPERSGDGHLRPAGRRLRRRRQSLSAWPSGIFSGRAVARLGRGLDRATAVVTASGLIFTSLGLLDGPGHRGVGSLAIRDLPIVGPYLLPLLFATSGYLFAYLGAKRHTDLARVLGFKGLLQQPGARQFLRPKLLDTSAIIDGRIAEVVGTGFLEGDLVIPSFVLEELQSIADSAEPGKRARGRRGLDTVHSLQESSSHVTIIERDFPAVPDVDTKLIKLARELKGSILTTDYNLDKVSQIQGVEVLNVNELAHCLKAAVLPGESSARARPARGQGGGPGSGLPRGRHHGGDRGRPEQGGRRGDGGSHLDSAEPVGQDGLRPHVLVRGGSTWTNGRRPSLALVVAAAGHGTRLGLGMPKQYAPLLGIPMLQRTLSALAACDWVDSLVVVVNEMDVEYCEEEIRLEHIPKVERVVAGGAKRPLSVRNGLEALADDRHLGSGRHP